MKNIRICCREENVGVERFFRGSRRKVFLFFFFVTKRLKYDVEGGERGYIFHLSLDIKGRKDFFFFLRGTFEVVEKKISRYFITSYYTFSFSTKYQNVMKRRIKAYRVETYVYHLRET